jgi:caffeoyl-CoA O-methyltransferase
MARMTPETWDYLARYGAAVFGREDETLSRLTEEAIAADLPAIAIAPDVGRLLMILTSMTRGRLAIEVGALGGYSGIWIARGLRPEGRLITIEPNPRHAEFASRQFERAGLSARVDLRLGPGLDVLSDLATELEPGSVDLVFLDAVKHEYTGYFEISRPLIAVGGLLVADNVYGVGTGWIDQGYGTDAFNRHIAADPDFEAVAVPLREGVLIARRIR